jgi:polysaccharide biosynthesis/export protein VpsN
MHRLLPFFVLLFGVLLGAHSHAQAPLRMNDSFEMRLSGMPAEFANDFYGQYTVSDDGNVNVPLIGGIRAVGLTPPQFARSVERKLVEQKIFTNPTVQVNLQVQSRFVTVGGAVRAPQAVPWSADLTLSSAIKRGGGPSDFANMKKVRLTREGKTSVFNLRLMDRDPNQNPKLLPGDEVEVPE